MISFRVYTHHLGTTFLPTICLVVIAEMTLFIDVNHFEATIMVALTSMLVMYTLYQSISATLPKTAYLKMIDYWLLGGLIIPFIVFNVLIIIDILITKSDSSDQVITKEGLKNINMKAKKALNYCRIFIPLITFLIVLLFWGIALHVSSLDL